MTVVTSAGAALDWFLVITSTPPSDPLAPVAQNPDDVRDAACRLVETDTVCSPPPPPDTIASSPGTNQGGGGGIGGLFGLLLWTLLIAVVLAVIYVAVKYFRDHRASTSDLDDETDPDDDALAGTVIIDRSREPRGWREEADAHRAAGRYRDAVRCRYRALVGDLARKGLLDEIPGRTTGEERRQLRATAPNAVPFFREAADLFDGAWYGHLAVDAADDDRLQQLDRDVLANAGALPHRIPKSYEIGVS